MNEDILKRVQEISDLSFPNPGQAKHFLRELKLHEPEVYQLLIKMREERMQPKVVEGCLIGERAWHVKATEEGFRLGSAHQSIWPVYEALEAVCADRNNHTPPHEGCDCGIYAVLPSRDAWIKDGVYGTVKLWGKYIEGSEKVYKAQYGYPATLDFTFCTRCRKKSEPKDCVAFVDYGSYNSEEVKFLCKRHIRETGPMLNLHVPASYVVDEIRKEYGLEESSGSIEGFIESLNLEGF